MNDNSCRYVAPDLKNIRMNDLGAPRSSMYPNVFFQTGSYRPAARMITNTYKDLNETC